MFSPDGKYIVYTSDESGRFRASDSMMSVKLTTTGTLAADAPVKLFEDDYLRRSSKSAYDDVSRDGQHFVMVRESNVEGVAEVRVVLDWFTELRAAADRAR